MRMKKLFFVFLVISLCLSLFACGGKYPAVESTSEELRTVFTLSHGSDKYEVKYELYRALFTSLKESIDGGDNSVWTGDKKDEYIEKINEKIIDYAAEIYSVFSLCKSAGIDVYSNSFENKIDEYIEASVDGGIVNGLIFMGFEGDYDKYLESLAKDGVNYSVQRLLLRYSLAVDAIHEYYVGEDLTDGADFGEIRYTENDIYDFYYSDECVRVIYAFLSKDAYTRKRAEEVRDVIASKDGDDAVASYVIGHTTTLIASDVKFGLLIAKNNLDARYFSEITESAFSLSMRETSPVFELNTGSEDGYVILYRTDKSDSYFENKYQNIIEVYIENEFGKILIDAKTDFINGAVETRYLSEINHSQIVPVK